MGDTEFWGVEDGVIVGRTTLEKPCYNTTYLQQKKRFRNFELEFKIKIEGEEANSGIQYRSNPFGQNLFDLSGYQLEFDVNHDKTGGLYETHGRGNLVIAGNAVRLLGGHLRSPIMDSNGLEKLSELTQGYYNQIDKNSLKEGQEEIS